MPENTLSLKDVLISPENMITKANVFIESSYRLTTLESKLILTLFSNVQPSDQDLNTYVFPIGAFVELLELKGKSKYKDLREITKGLMKKSFEIKIDHEVHQVSWLSYVKYNEVKGSITLRFDPFWKPYILQIQKNFTTYKLGNITKLNSTYSIRLYELLKQRQGLKSRTFYLSDLRDKLGIPEEVYPKYGNFKQRVLLTAQRELLQESDITFDFIEIKHGRSVEQIKFMIFENTIIMPVQVEAVTMIEETDHELLRDLLSIGLSKKDAEILISLFPEVRIRENIDYTIERVKLGRVKKPPAYLKRAIEQDFASTKTPKSTGKVEKEPEWFKKPTTKMTSKIEDKEKLFIRTMELMESLGTPSEKIRHDLAVEMQRYIEECTVQFGQTIHYESFNDPFLQEVCKEVTLKLHSSYVVSNS